MSELENCIRGLLGKSVALNLTNRRIKSNNYLFLNFFIEKNLYIWNNNTVNLEKMEVVTFDYDI